MTVSGKRGSRKTKENLGRDGEERYD